MRTASLTGGEGFPTNIVSSSAESTEMEDREDLAFPLSNSVTKVQPQAAVNDRLATIDATLDDCEVVEPEPEPPIPLSPPPDDLPHFPFSHPTDPNVVQAVTPETEVADVAISDFESDLDDEFV